jgi:hypothetical protein
MAKINLIRALKLIQYQEDIAPQMSYALNALLNVTNLTYETYGNMIWCYKVPSDWLAYNFYPFLSDLSDSGRYISSNESALILSLAADSSFYSQTNITQNQLATLIERFNNTERLRQGLINPTTISNVTNIMNLTLIGQLSELYQQDVNVTSSFGYASIQSWLVDLLKMYDQLPVRQTVCAKVTLLISQTLVLTREGFEAKLEIDNLEPQTDVTNLSVHLSIYRADDVARTSLANGLFSIGMPKLTTISGSLQDGMLFQIMSLE